MNLLMKRTTRARLSKGVHCHDSCDNTMSPYRIKRKRREMKRRERQAWKKEVR